MFLCKSRRKKNPIKCQSEKHIFRHIGIAHAVLLCFVTDLQCRTYPQKQSAKNFKSLIVATVTLKVYCYNHILL